ncbi:hypothetical protein [Streptomyces sp. NPDC096032]|uniref:hypothetical protein n=1 Tax=Streptomyces sp. NPDC096032 TaxID=3366070 RepID=UPI00382D9A0C
MSSSIAKTLGALRTINEALTACRDAVVRDLDPIKGGLAEFGDLASRRARTPEECEEALEEALAYVTARGKLLPTLGMGDRWHATESTPTSTSTSTSSSSSVPAAKTSPSRSCALAASTASTCSWPGRWPPLTPSATPSQ